MFDDRVIACHSYCVMSASLRRSQPTLCQLYRSATQSSTVVVKYNGASESKMVCAVHPMQTANSLSLHGLQCSASWGYLQAVSRDLSIVFIRTLLLLSFCYTPKDLPPFYYIPHKNPSFNDKVWTIDFLLLVFSELSTATSANRYCNCWVVRKISPPTNPAMHLLS